MKFNCMASVCCDTILCITGVECCAVECVCMYVWDWLHLCCEVSESIVDHVCDCVLRGISEHFGERFGATVA